nr:hypothetical protein [Tanacetum cinerariifolium]
MDLCGPMRVESFNGTVKFKNDQIAPILGYGDSSLGNITIKRVYYAEGLNHNLFFVGQFCDADLEVAFRKSTCYIRDLKGNDLLTAWLWHRRLSHLNFNTINLLSKYDIITGLPKLKFVKNHLCSSCELGKAKCTVKFKNDQIAPILGYGDSSLGNITIKRVYYAEGLNHNLFFVGQFCDADLEVAFRKSTCYIRDLKGNDLLTAWLWHRRLSHLNFNTINLLSKYDIITGLPKLKFVKNHLCSSCELGKAKSRRDNLIHRLLWVLKAHDGKSQASK